MAIYQVSGKQTPIPGLPRSDHGEHRTLRMACLEHPGTAGRFDWAEQDDATGLSSAVFRVADIVGVETIESG